MKVLVVGNGGREHAICRALVSGPQPPALLIAPGNPGTAALGRNVAVSASDIEALVRLAVDEQVDLVVPGPELPLVLGLADRLAQAGIPCCGPSEATARLEGSKAFTREVTTGVGVPSPRFAVVQDEDALEEAVRGWDGVPVLKADGLAAGKGVFLPETKEGVVTMGRRLLAGELGDAGRTLVLEDRLVGVEASLFYACDGLDAVALPHARDHKRLGDGDQGPNTGGMGAISPNPIVTPQLEAEVRATVVEPSLKALADRGTPFRGFLFVGLMLTEAGPKLLEFNVRLGDPEAQAILPRLAPGAFLDLCCKVAQGKLAGVQLAVDPQATCAVVLAAAGYPQTPRKSDVIRVDGRFAQGGDRWLDHAGTALTQHSAAAAPAAEQAEAEQGTVAAPVDAAGVVVQDNAVVTHGGRVAAVVARGNDAESARTAAYAGVDLIRFDGMQVRRDIGAARSL